MMQGMKPSSAVLSRPSDSGQTIINCCMCSCDFHPANYEDKAMRICPSCAKIIDEDIKLYAENDTQSDEDVLDVSYFIILMSVISINFHMLRLPRRP